MTQGYNHERGAFVQAYGSTALDASNLLMPLVKFVGPTDARMLSTLEATQRELVSDSLVYRYDPETAASDGLAGREGTFSMCSFWYVECLARAGRVDEARLTFEKMLTYANHLGLYAEQIGASGEALGNFPQAFTHLALISAAFTLNRTLEGDHAALRALERGTRRPETVMRRYAPCMLELALSEARAAAGAVVHGQLARDGAGTRRSGRARARRAEPGRLRELPRGERGAGGRRHVRARDPRRRAAGRRRDASARCTTRYARLPTAR